MSDDRNDLPEYTKEEILAHRAQWLADLRSGKYRQTTGKLKSRNGAYCCLGVAECAAGVEAVWVHGESGSLAWDHYEFNGADTALDWKTAAWLGFTTTTPSLSDGTSLIDLNDDHGYTFAMIADAIDAQGFCRGDEVRVMRS